MTRTRTKDAPSTSEVRTQLSSYFLLLPTTFSLFSSKRASSKGTNILLYFPRSPSKITSFSSSFLLFPVPGFFEIYQRQSVLCVLLVVASAAFLNGSAPVALLPSYNLCFCLWRYVFFLPLFLSSMTLLVNTEVLVINKDTHTHTYIYLFSIFLFFSSLYRLGPFISTLFARGRLNESCVFSVMLEILNVGLSPVFFFFFGITSLKMALYFFHGYSLVVFNVLWNVVTN